tara:strand:- start:359 stop:583 length:225 start_codon:yes stop_codon:yes gene_type:complete
MKKSDWLYIANAMWLYGDKHGGRVSDLLKELVVTVNKNKEMIIDDKLEDDEPNVRIHAGQDTNTTSEIDSNRTR